MNTLDMARAVVGELRDIIEYDIDHDPRTLQTEIGPSEIGTGCDRCLIHKLAGTPEQAATGTPWLPNVGRAVHEANEMAVVRYLARTGRSDWIPEGVVTVGDIDGHPVTGHADAFHVPTGTVVDYKLVGASTLKKVRFDGSGTSCTYRSQFHLYGRGYQRLGYTVRAVVGWYMPRNGRTLADSRYFIEEYDEQVAVDALDRATRFAQWIKTFGADKVLAAAAPHTGDEFSCDRYPDATPKTTGQHQLDGLIPA